MSVGYGAVERFGPEDGEVWSNYVGRFGAPHLKEVVSLDGSLCPNLVTDLTDEDWRHNLVEDDLIFYFRNLDYFLSRFDVPSNYQILAVVKNPNGSETLPDPRFEFIGYDLTEAGVQNGISAVTNCGGWENVLQTSDLSEQGLVVSYERVTQIKESLRLYYPDDPHALCDLYAVWRMMHNSPLKILSDDVALAPKVNGYILYENIFLLFYTIAERAGYILTDWDIDAVRYGLLSLPREGGRFEYTLYGTNQITFTLSRKGGEHIDAEISVPNEPMSTMAQAVTSIMERLNPDKPFLGMESLLATTFSNRPYPGDSGLMACDTEHFLICSECQDTYQHFVGKRWEAALTLQWDLPVYFADISLLSEAARLYFFPAYLTVALETRNAETLDYAVEALGKSVEQFSSYQKEVVHFFHNYLKTKAKE